MNALKTIGLALVVIISSLLFMSSSICAVEVAEARGVGIIFALIFLGVSIGGIRLIAKLNRKQQ